MVSVIIPNYNHAQYLEQRIESVLCQTYTDFEIIILDDCSTDDSTSIIEKYRSHRKISCVVYNDINSGNTFRQWEKGIGLCKGDYIWIAESDDWCDHSFLENVLTGMLQTEKCVIGYCQSYCIDDHNVIRWQSSHRYLNDQIGGQAFIKTHLLTTTSIFNASMAIWKKDTFALITREFINYRFCGDWLFWVELCMHGNVFISGKLLNYFRKHEGDVSGKASRGGQIFMDELKMFTLLYQRKWISYKNLLASFRSIYVHYKAVESSLPASIKKQTINLFYYEPGVKSHLQFFYLGYYTRHTVKKLINSLLS